MQIVVKASQTAVVCALILFLGTCDVSAQKKFGRRRGITRETQFNAQSFLGNPRLIGEITEGSIDGLTVLGNELFVLSVLHKRQVNSYDTSTFKPTRNLTIHGATEQLFAIVASPKHNCLFIANPSQLSIYRYDLSDNVVSDWFVGDYSFGLSLTSTQNVLATIMNTPQIREYTPDGSLVRAINLEQTMLYSWNSIQLPNDQFLISQGGSGIQNRVCIVDNSGSIVKCFGGERGSDVGNLSSPYGMAVDAHGNILVADYGNSRIVLLSPSLNHLGYVTIPGNTIKDPLLLHLDEETRRLYIGESSSSGRILILTA